MTTALASTLEFLRELRLNNNKQWFEAHRVQYQAAQRAFEDLVTELILRFDDIESLSGITAKECIFRIYRDVRFSPDKSPYKINMGAGISARGKNAKGNEYYLHIQPDGESFLGGGMYIPSSDDLRNYREAVARKPEKLRKLLGDKNFVRVFGKVEGEQLKTAPKGYAPDHPAIDLLRYKQMVASLPLPDDVVTSSDLSDLLLDSCKVLKPFLDYFKEIMA
ncbi:MAG: DUF2461 domain-containing protein [Anaerolineae bacterium]|nr:DUF2461 domain-containing protein [Anaerolineae bacterium]